MRERERGLAKGGGGERRADVEIVGERASVHCDSSTTDSPPFPIVAPSPFPTTFLHPSLSTTLCTSVSHPSPFLPSTDDTRALSSSVLPFRGSVDFCRSTRSLSFLVIVTGSVCHFKELVGDFLLIFGSLGLYGI